MTYDPLVKKTIRLREEKHKQILLFLQPGQFSHLVRTFMSCIHDKFMDGKINEVLLFAARRKPITLDPKKEKNHDRD